MLKCVTHETLFIKTLGLSKDSRREAVESSDTSSKRAKTSFVETIAGIDKYQVLKDTSGIVQHYHEEVSIGIFSPLNTRLPLSNTKIDHSIEVIIN